MISLRSLVPIKKSCNCTLPDMKQANFSSHHGMSYSGGGGGGGGGGGQCGCSQAMFLSMANQIRSVMPPGPPGIGMGFSSSRNMAHFCTTFFNLGPRGRDGREGRQGETVSLLLRKASSVLELGCVRNVRVPKIDRSAPISIKIALFLTALVYRMQLRSGKISKKKPYYTGS